VVDESPRSRGSSPRRRNDTRRRVVPSPRVAPRTRSEPGHILIEVEDECGGLEKPDDVFRPFGDRRGTDRSGLGLGLSISRKAVAANGGELRALSLPGKGCIFTIDLPAGSAVGSAAG
jgi:signal transduction histidine kinase